MSWLHLSFQTLGGIGLFLLGMTLLTDGLKAFAGNALRSALVKFAGTPLMAFGSGAVATLLVQSSTATTVTVIGFVSAGLLSFPQAVGVVIGASLGTTATGWLVALLGLKVSVGLYALPMIGVGALTRMFARKRWQSLGIAIAGFGLIFVGIETLQQGMNSLSAHVDISAMPVGGVAGSLLMVLVGILMTVIMQSSSAAVATTLTALHTGSVLFPQAMAIVIGAAIGTTATGALAAIGGTTAAKRTALAHVSFNAWCGLLALLLLPLYEMALGWAQRFDWLNGGATGLAAFHSTFIAVGALTILPWVGVFSRTIERALPERQPTLTRRLDPTVLSVPQVAVEAAEMTLKEIASELTELVVARERGVSVSLNYPRVLEVEQALDQSRQFMAAIPPVAANQPMSARRLCLMHAMDHLFRLLGYAKREDTDAALQQESMNAMRTEFREALQLAREGLQEGRGKEWEEQLKKRSRSAAALRGRQRERLLQTTADGAYSPEEALQMLNALRWMDGSIYHTWRIAHYLGGRGSAEADDSRFNDSINGSHSTQLFEGL